jgi:hypothetical protein
MAKLSTSLFPIHTVAKVGSTSSARLGLRAAAEEERGEDVRPARGRARPPGDVGADRVVAVGARHGDVVQHVRVRRVGAPVAASRAHGLPRGRRDALAGEEVDERRRAPGLAQRRHAERHARGPREQHRVRARLRRVVDAVRLVAGGDAVPDRDVARHERRRGGRGGERELRVVGAGAERERQTERGERGRGGAREEESAH